MNWIGLFQLFLFDFDGLLVDTEALHYMAYVQMLEKRGYQLEWSFAEFLGIAHLNSTAIREGIYAKFQGLEPNWSILYAEKTQEYLRLISEGQLKLMPGVQNMLGELEKTGVRRCVVTNSTLEQTKLIRAQLPILNTIPHWITREDYEKPKPNPECYLRAIQLYGKEGDRIIGFEDSLRGLEALKGTPATAVLVCPSHHPLIDIATEGDVKHFESFEEMPQEW